MLSNNTTVIPINNTALPVEANPFGGAVGQDGTDAAFVIMCTFIVFTMQSGFGLLESGMVSSKSEGNVMVKNLIDVVLGGVAFWFLGYGFGFGPNDKQSNKMSGEGYFTTDVDLISAAEAHAYTIYFFQLSFATSATTIVSGAVAERIKFSSYMIFVIFMTGFIYVFPAHWMWHKDGWLYQNANDFAGSSVVHMAGGAAAFAGCVLLGPRHNRYEGQKKAFAMARPTNVILGTFILWWGWIGFNCGSKLSITGNGWRVVSRVAVVTMNGAMGGGTSIVIGNLIMYRWRKYILDIGEITAGVLGGLVAITAPCDQIRPWEGLFIGFIGGIVAVLFNKLLQMKRIDDPVGCIGVHWAAGLWGMFATGLFGMDKGAFRGNGGKMLGYNIAASLVITLWSGGLSFIVFASLNKIPFIGLRLRVQDEEIGSDKIEHDIETTGPLKMNRMTINGGLDPPHSPSQSGVPDPPHSTAQIGVDNEVLQSTVN